MPGYRIDNPSGQIKHVCSEHDLREYLRRAPSSNFQPVSYPLYRLSRPYRDRNGEYGTEVLCTPSKADAEAKARSGSRSGSPTRTYGPITYTQIDPTIQEFSAFSAPSRGFQQASFISDDIEDGSPEDGTPEDGTPVSDDEAPTTIAPAIIPVARGYGAVRLQPNSPRVSATSISSPVRSSKITVNSKLSAFVTEAFGRTSTQPSLATINTIEFTKRGQPDVNAYYSALRAVDDASVRRELCNNTILSVAWWKFFILDSNFGVFLEQRDPDLLRALTRCGRAVLNSKGTWDELKVTLFVTTSPKVVSATIDSLISCLTVRMYLRMEKYRLNTELVPRLRPIEAWYAEASLAKLRGDLDQLVVLLSSQISLRDVESELFIAAGRRPDSNHLAFRNKLVRWNQSTIRARRSIIDAIARGFTKTEDIFNDAPVILGEITRGLFGDVSSSPHYQPTWEPTWVHVGDDEPVWGYPASDD